MSQSPEPKPPKWADRILSWYCRNDILEDLQGDLYEFFYKRVDEKGVRNARRNYVLDVLKFFRLYTVQKPKIIQQMTFFNLIENYYKTSVRSIARNKLFSSINIIGLAVAMSVGLLMITYVGESLTFDEFHQKKERIYRVISTYRSITNSNPLDLASTSIFIGDKLRGESPGVEKVLIMRRIFSVDMAKGENVVNVNGHYSSPEFFDVFSFELVAGDPATALLEPYSVVLTQKASRKLFKEENPVGQIVKAGDESYTITGVIKDVPPNSHIQFEALASLSTFRNQHTKEEDRDLFEWRSIWMNHVYLLIEEEAQPETIAANMAMIADEENAKSDRFSIDLTLENLKEISPGRELSNQIGPTIAWKGIYQMLGLTIIIILSACFNYTNLSIARSLRRAREVGIRKVVGATRSQVFIQFIFEAVIISLLSLFLAVGLYLLIRPEFINSIVDRDNIGMDFKLIYVLYFMVFAIGIGLIAGVLPSLVLSKLKAISILSDITKIRLLKGVNLRRILIVLQFAISMALIIGATITYRQYNFSINYDLGFTSENVLNLELTGNDSEVLMNELSKLPEISAMSRSGMVPCTGEIWGDEVKYNDPNDSTSIYINYVDKAYPIIHQMSFLAGGSFPYDLNSDDVNGHFIIIDRALSEKLGFEAPLDALGEKLSMYYDDTSLEIVGVIENYQYANLESDPAPTALVQGTREDFRHINMIVSTADMIGLMDKLESIWSDVDNVHPFEASFTDELVEETYSHYEMMYRIFTFLALLAISISTMGLLGIAVFTTETKIKEISIRKVLGATEGNIMMILSRSFMWMLVVSGVIAIPVTYYLFAYFLLADLKDRISIGFVELVPGVLIIILIGMLTISWQTLKAARTNPSETLRDE